MKTNPHIISHRDAALQNLSRNNHRSPSKNLRLPHCHGNLNTTRGNLTPMSLPPAQLLAYSTFSPLPSTGDIEPKTKGDQIIITSDDHLSFLTQNQGFPFVSDSGL